MTSSNTLKGLIYAVKCQASMAGKLASTVNNYNRISSFDNLDREELNSNLEKTVSSLKEEGNKSPLNQERAKKILMARDLEKIQQLIKERTISNVENNLRDSFGELISEFDDIGVEMHDLNFEIVDQYPSPYSSMEFEAMGYDVYDQEEFGIPIGVKLKRDSLKPLYSISLLAHELVHLVFGNKYSNRLARGLEDGICDLYGAFFLTGNLLSFSISQNILLNQRKFFPTDQFWDIYSNNLQQAILIYKHFGLKGIEELLRKGKRKGRKYIKKVELCSVRGQYSDISLPEGKKNKKLDKFADYYLSYPRYIVVSPLARLLAENIEVQKGVEEVLEELEVDREEGRKAINELQERVYLVLLEEDTFVSNETDLYLDTGLLRYEV